MSVRTTSVILPPACSRSPAARGRREVPGAREARRVLHVHMHRACHAREPRRRLRGRGQHLISRRKTAAVPHKSRARCSAGQGPSRPYGRTERAGPPRGGNAHREWRTMQARFARKPGKSSAPAPAKRAGQADVRTLSPAQPAQQMTEPRHAGIAE